MSQLANKTSDLRSLITSEKMKTQFAAALPHHLSADRFCRIALTALTRTPKLMDCTPESLMRCLLDLSAYGIEPDGRRAHLIPYGNTCTLILDWKGLAELAMRSGIIAKLHADVVCENDVFTYNLGEVIEHKIDWKQPRGAMYAAYAMAVTKDGPVFVAVLTREEIDGIRKRSKASGSGPWVTDYNEMAKKTAFRRLAKWLPLSAEFRDAVEKEDDFPQEREVTPKRTAARAVPLDPFTKPAEIEAAPVVEAEPVEKSEIFKETMYQIEQANTPHSLNMASLMCAEIMDETERTAAKAAVDAHADALQLKFDGANFVPFFQP
jgi:recombination protein RecT